MPGNVADIAFDVDHATRGLRPRADGESAGHDEHQDDCLFDHDGFSFVVGR